MLILIIIKNDFPFCSFFSLFFFRFISDFMQSMNCRACHKWRVVLFMALFGIVNSVGLRTNDSELNLSSAIVSKSSNHPQFFEKYISSQNLFGLILITLIVSSICYGFIFTGLPDSNHVEVHIGWTELLSESAPIATIKEEEDVVNDKESSFTVVIKANSVDISATHHVLGIAEHSATFDYSKCEIKFIIDRLKLATSSFTIIIREGNIPVYFENIKAETFLCNGMKDNSDIKGIKRAYYIDMKNLPQNEVKLKNKILRIHYGIQK